MHLTKEIIEARCIVGANRDHFNYQDFGGKLSDGDFRLMAECIRNGAFSEVTLCLDVPRRKSSGLNALGQALAASQSITQLSITIFHRDSISLKSVISFAISSFFSKYKFGYADTFIRTAIGAGVTSLVIDYQESGFTPDEINPWLQTYPGLVEYAVRLGYEPDRVRVQQAESQSPPI